MVTRILIAVGLSLGVAAGFGVGDGVAEAAGGSCEEGTIAPTRSCAKGEIDFARSCCPEGYRPHGIAYVDAEGGDDTKAITSVCRPVAGGDDLVAQPLGDGANMLVCGSVEIFNGVACRDLPDSDSLDGCTAICTQASTKTRRYLANPDIDDNETPLRESATPKYHSRSKTKSRVLGVAYKTLPSEGGELDCAAIEYKSEPVVK